MRYFGIDESMDGNGTVVTVAACAYRRASAELHADRMQKRRSRFFEKHPDYMPGGTFTYAFSGTDEHSRVSAICGLLAERRFSPSDQAIIDGAGPSIEEKFARGMAWYGISVNGNVRFVPQADERVPIVNDADVIAYFIMQRGEGPFESRRAKTDRAADLKRYLDETYKKAGSEH